MFMPVSVPVSVYGHLCMLSLGKMIWQENQKHIFLTLLVQRGKSRVTCVVRDLLSVGTPRNLWSRGSGDSAYQKLHTGSLKLTRNAIMQPKPIVT